MSHGGLEATDSKWACRNTYPAALYRPPGSNWDCTGFEAVASAIGLDRRTSTQIPDTRGWQGGISTRRCCEGVLASPLRGSSVLERRCARFDQVCLIRWGCRSFVQQHALSDTGLGVACALLPPRHSGSQPASPRVTMSLRGVLGWRREPPCKGSAPDHLSALTLVLT